MASWLVVCRAQFWKTVHIEEISGRYLSTPSGSDEGGGAELGRGFCSRARGPWWGGGPSAGRCGPGQARSRWSRVSEENVPRDWACWWGGRASEKPRSWHRGQAWTVEGQRRDVLGKLQGLAVASGAVPGSAPTCTQMSVPFKRSFLTQPSSFSLVAGPPFPPPAFSTSRAAVQAWLGRHLPSLLRPLPFSQFLGVPWPLALCGRVDKQLTAMLVPGKLGGWWKEAFWVAWELLEGLGGAAFRDALWLLA